MIWTDSPCNVTCWNNGNLFTEAYRDPSIETVIAQHPWLENDCYFADLILPVATKHEMSDLCNDFSSGVYQSVYLTDPAAPPSGSPSPTSTCASRWRRSWGPSTSGPTPATA